MRRKNRTWKNVPHSRSMAEERIRVLDSTLEIGLKGELMGIPGSASITFKIFTGVNATGFFTRALTLEITIEESERIRCYDVQCIFYSTLLH